MRTTRIMAAALIVVARNREQLEALATRLMNQTGRSIKIIVADLTNEADLAKVERVLGNDASITVLVNNAGIAINGDMASANPDHLESMILLNVLAPSRLALAVIPGFVSRGHGTLINISSTAALAPEPFGGYSGTKAYMLALSLRLQQELAGKGIHVQVVQQEARTDTGEHDGNLIGLPIPPGIGSCAE